MGTELPDDLGGVAQQLRTLSEDLRAESEKVAQLSDAVQTRDVIGQAKGILMERHKISDQEAFAFLCRVSNRTNTKLYEVAVQLARTGIIATEAD